MNMTLERIREEQALEKLVNTNIALKVLNDTFKVWEFNGNVISGVLQGKRTEYNYIIVNSYLLQIKDKFKKYSYQLNGAEGKNTKFIMELEGLNFNIDSSEKMGRYIAA